MNLGQTIGSHKNNLGHKWMKCTELQLLNINSALTTWNSQERQYC